MQTPPTTTIPITVTTLCDHHLTNTSVLHRLTATLLTATWQRAFIALGYSVHNHNQAAVNPLLTTLETGLGLVWFSPVFCPENRQPWTATSLGPTQILREPNRTT
ncbi:uncharacterized protein LACBIDRAFT_323915 [Laccaria bicolor S238N-H82]|uniref:Predicted protein n=1 Tax=Laccaria bicolor (strain S238N-H82 / ATCC MYA-4686) TaxID=486041 RepID=B0D019_LACBS|nr:uncharacterized protein LACBIDRAFT_323915 [Laccaria bicolor S238N-H82]EDR11751.1 predicted protein [Laccaria bicolor S238N-H82]|eukprot:XP_001877648.1 predicted protein [Laccaria bicolor S238N-H82]